MTHTHLTLYLLVRAGVLETVGLAGEEDSDGSRKRDKVTWLTCSSHA